MKAFKLAINVLNFVNFIKGLSSLKRNIILNMDFSWNIPSGVLLSCLGFKLLYCYFRGDLAPIIFITRSVAFAYLFLIFGAVSVACYKIYLNYWRRAEDGNNEVVPTSPMVEEEEREDVKEEVVPTSPMVEEEEREDVNEEVVPTSPMVVEEEEREDVNEEVVPTSPKVEEEEERKADKNDEVVLTSPKVQEEQRKDDKPAKRRKRKGKLRSKKKKRNIV
ncbi:hypothetical protein CEXT_569131 [Caerostris extrusa]|uniref:Uncharacterized protein n=1 Tax=Caerostris extrusa TaxID=172846 RepID=A0AAV4TUH0_CAEEX|nr:hypothetical protein CEXT_569131 [Caerostris extrusa]